jgi:hypothetical protein
MKCRGLYMRVEYEKEIQNFVKYDEILQKQILDEYNGDNMNLDLFDVIVLKAKTDERLKDFAEYLKLTKYRHEKYI